MALPPARVLVNPTAGRSGSGSLGERLRTIPGLEVRLTENADDIAEQAALAASEGLDRLLVAGGDGTLHHAIRGLAGTGCALGIVPAGSGNDLARALAVPRGDPLAAARRALSATARRIDLGRIAGRSFACTAGVGFDGAVARFVRERARGLPRAMIYPYAVARTLLRFRPPIVSIAAAGFTFDGPVTLAVLANAPFFGGGMRIAPLALVDDGWLDLVLVLGLSRWRLLGAFPRVYGGTHLRHPAVRTARLRAAEVSVQGPATFYGDGEPVAQVAIGPTSVEIWPGALSVV